MSQRRGIPPQSGAVSRISQAEMAMARALALAGPTYCVPPGSTYNAARMAGRNTRQSPKLSRVRRGGRAAFHAFIFASLVGPWLSGAAAKVVAAVHRGAPADGKPKAVCARNVDGTCPGDAAPCDKGTRSESQGLAGTLSPSPVPFWDRLTRTPPKRGGVCCGVGHVAPGDHAHRRSSQPGEPDAGDQSGVRRVFVDPNHFCHAPPQRGRALADLPG